MKSIIKCFVAITLTCNVLGYRLSANSRQVYADPSFGEDQEELVNPDSPSFSPSVPALENRPRGGQQEETSRNNNAARKPEVQQSHDEQYQQAQVDEQQKELPNKSPARKERRRPSPPTQKVPYYEPQEPQIPIEADHPVKEVRRNQIPRKTQSVRPPLPPTTLLDNGVPRKRPVHVSKPVQQNDENESQQEFKDSIQQEQQRESNAQEAHVESDKQEDQDEFQPKGLKNKVPRREVRKRPSPAPQQVPYYEPQEVKQVKEPARNNNAARRPVVQQSYDEQYQQAQDDEQQKELPNKSPAREESQRPATELSQRVPPVKEPTRKRPSRPSTAYNYPRVGSNGETYQERKRPYQY